MQRSEALQQDRQTLASVAATAEERSAQAAQAAREKFSGIEAKIKALIEEKHQVAREEITKDELLKNAKRALAEGRRNVIQRILVPHLKSCRRPDLVPFTESTMRVHSFPEGALYKLFFLACEEADLEAAVNLLPDDESIGALSREERQKRIAEIDEEISRLRRELE